MLLTGILMLIGLTLCLISYFFWKKNSATTNHYTHKKQKTGPSLGKNPLTDVRFDSQESDDPDVVLGIKTPTNTTVSDTTITQKSNEAAKNNVDHNQMVVLYLMSSSDSNYAGYELLQALLSAGLRFGDRQIFHRHAYKDGRGDVLFHCASAEKPGTFDVSKMGDFATRGLCFFFVTDSVHDPLALFDTMLETIDQLVEDLGGEVLDANRQLFTKERMLTLRQQLKNIAVHSNTADLFA